MSSTGAVLADIKSTPGVFTTEHIDTALMLAAEKLTPKRAAFADAYVRNGFNGSAALIEAKYKAKSPQVASAAAARLLANVNIQDYLRWRMVQLTQQKDIEIDEGRLIRESNALAFSCLTDVISWDEKGRITVKPVNELPREVAAAIRKFKCVTKLIPNGDNEPIETTTVEIEMHDKKGALDLQARIAGMLREAKQSDYRNYTLNMYFGEPPPKDRPPVAG